MRLNTKIGILGGDMRQAVLCRRLSEYGLEVAAFGVANGDIGDAVRCVDYKAALEKSRAVILPLPSFTNGKYVVTPFNGGEAVSLSEILYNMSKDALLICGKADIVVRNSAYNHGIELVDCFESEELQIKNAIPTAEGAIEIAMRELPITLNGSKMLVCGYGRIGKILSSLLHKLGAKVYVCARKESDLAYAEAFGYTSVGYEEEAFKAALAKADAVFSTVPFCVVNKSVIQCMSRCKLIVDLASGDGGVDFEAAAEKGIKTIHALALPGKVAPVTAGENLADSIYSILAKRGVMSKK